VDVSIEPLLRGIAGVVLGLPMRATEKVVHIKGETITKKLVWLLEKERWEELDSVLENRFDIAKDDREEFYLEIVLGRKFDSAAFRCWGKKFGRLKPAARAKFLRQIARIVGRPAETITREIQLV
jgi:hypothetical protein